MKSLNRVQLIGNLTRDPELRYTPAGAAVATFGLATNRTYAGGENKERQEEVEFHNIVVWAKLAEICNEYLTKGQKIYVEGRIQTRSWDSPEGEKKYKTEIVVEDMIMLGGRGEGGESRPAGDRPAAPERRSAPEPVDQNINPDEIPF